MKEANWEGVQNDSDTQSAYSTFHKMIAKQFELSIPYKPVTSEYNNRLPWLMQAMKNSITRKHKLDTKQLKHHTTENIQKYNFFRNKLNHIRTYILPE
jgi:hypothetical protein